MIARLFAASGVFVENWLSRSTVGRALRRAGRPSRLSSASDLKPVRLASANSGRFSSSVASWSADWLRSASAGVWASVAAPSLAIVGSSSRRNAGSRCRLAAICSRRSAEAEAVWRVSVTKRPTLVRFLARSPMTASASRVRLARTLFWSARIASTSSVSRSAGTARASVSWMSVDRPPTPAPSSLRMIPSRSRYGRRMMLLITSSGIVDAVCSTGSVAPGFMRSAAVPGRQST